MESLGLRPLTISSISEYSKLPLLPLLDGPAAFALRLTSTALALLLRFDGAASCTHHSHVGISPEGKP